MVLPDEMAQASAAAQQVTMVIHEVQRIANHTMDRLGTDASTHKTTFEGVDTGLGAWGQVPKAVALGEHHRAAHEIFVETYQGVVDDLVAFRDNLLACAGAHQSNDEQVQSALLRLSTGYGDHRFDSDRRHDHSSNAHHDDLYDAAQGEARPQPAPATPGKHAAPRTPTTTPSADPSTDAGSQKTGLS